MLLVSVVIALLSTPPAMPPVVSPTPAVPAAVGAAFGAWLAEAGAAGRVVELLGVRTTPTPTSRPDDPGADRTVALFADRSGGCMRGWARLTFVIPRGSAFASREVEELLAPACDARPTALSHFARFVEGVRRGDWATLAGFLPGGEAFPISLETSAGLKRKTWDGRDVKAGKVPFPTCDLFDETPTCAEPRPAGRATCACTGPLRTLEVDFQLDPAQPAWAQLVSIREKVR